MEKRTIAYTGDDLVQIGRIVNRITKRLKAFEGYSDSNIEDNVDNLYIDVVFEGEVVGYVAYEDGWIGYFPNLVREVTKENN